MEYVRKDDTGPLGTLDMHKTKEVGTIFPARPATLSHITWELDGETYAGFPGDNPDDMYTLLTLRVADDETKTVMVYGKMWTADIGQPIERFIFTVGPPSALLSRQPLSHRGSVLWHVRPEHRLEVKF